MHSIARKLAQTPIASSPWPVVTAAPTAGSTYSPCPMMGESPTRPGCLPLLPPVATAIPGVATAPILIVIGAMMMPAAMKVDWSQYRQSVPAFLAIVGMPFTYSITDGISLGIITHTAIMAVTGKARDVHPVMYALTVLLLWRVFFVGD